MVGVRTFALLAVAGLLAGGCARLSGANTESGGSTITVTASDSGRTISLHVGDRLVVNLGPSFAGAADGLIRTSVQFPRDLLTMSPDKSKLGHWDFTAKAAGTGKVTVISAPCGPLLGPAPAAAAPCPVTGETDGSPSPAAAGGPALPARLFSVDVHIT
jgi:hypothetical protein